MRIDLITLFPEMCYTVLDESILGRARRAGWLDVRCHNIRDYSDDRHRRIDDTPYGGGKGMLMECEPIYQCYQTIAGSVAQKPHVIFMSPQGKTLNQQRVKELAQMEHLVVLCGHYEGVDQRVLDEIVDEEISVGDFVLTGGELGALILVDSVGRLCPGVLSDTVCFTEESHWNGLLEYPQYTRPPVWRGRAVPEVLQSGHHAKIVAWQRQKSLENTFYKRPELLEHAQLTREDLVYLEQLKHCEEEPSC